MSKHWSFASSLLAAFFRKAARPELDSFFAFDFHLPPVLKTVVPLFAANSPASNFFIRGALGMATFRCAGIFILRACGNFNIFDFAVLPPVVHLLLAFHFPPNAFKFVGLSSGAVCRRTAPWGKCKSTNSSLRASASAPLE